MTLLRNAVCATANSSKPSTRFGSLAKMPVDSGQAVAFLHFGMPADLVKGATIISATLRVYQYGAWTGSRTLSVQRNAAAFKVAQVNWNNKPNVVGSGAVAVTQTGTADLAVWAFDVASDVQAWVDGTAGKYGWRLYTSDTTTRYVRGALAAKGKPTLEVVYAYAPADPTDLHPSAGAVSIAKPRLRFSSGEFDSVNVQVAPAASSSPAFDSGWVSTTAEEFDLSTSTYAGLANGASTSWRARVRKGSRSSGWSDWATFSRVNKPTVTISDPTSTVYEPTPPFNATLSSGTFTKVRWLVARITKPTTYIYDSGVVPTTTGDLTPPKPVFTQRIEPYIVTVRAWDAVDREETFGDPTYVTASVTTTLVNDPGGPNVPWVDALQSGPEPWVNVRWGWTATEPDGWAIMRDGVLVATFDLAADANVGGSVYAWLDYTAPPNQSLTYTVAPIVNGKTSAPTTVAEITVNGQGIWLFDPETGDALVVWGDDAGTFANGEDATTFRPIGASQVVRITNSISGLEGQVPGVFLDTAYAENYPALTCEATLNSFIGAEQIYRLSLGHRNIPVRIFEVSSTVSPLTDPTQTVIPVVFGYTQAGELPFDVDF